VGPHYVRFLRTIIDPSVSGEYIFKHIYYVPVESIALIDSKGANVPFKSSTMPTKVVLHFRRVYKNPSHSLDKPFCNDGSFRSVLLTTGGSRAR